MSMEAIMVSFAVVVEKDGMIHFFKSESVTILLHLARHLFCEGGLVDGVQTSFCEYCRLLPVLVRDKVPTDGWFGCVGVQPDAELK